MENQSFPLALKGDESFCWHQRILKAKNFRRKRTNQSQFFKNLKTRELKLAQDKNLGHPMCPIVD